MDGRRVHGCSSLFPETCKVAVELFKHGGGAVEGEMVPPL